MDDETLDEIANELHGRGLVVRALGYGGIAMLSPIWSVIDPVEDIVIRVMVTPGANGTPQFWAEAFCSSNAPFVTPIITKLGDAANEVLVRRACRARNEHASKATA